MRATPERARRAETMLEIDTARVICALAEIDDPGARGFTCGAGRLATAWICRAPRRARAGLRQLLPARRTRTRPAAATRFLTSDGALILCSSHGALFEPEQGLCIAGPCRGARLRALPLRLTAGYVLLADEVPLVEPADLPRTNGGN